MEIELIYALRKRKKFFWLQVEFMGVIKERSYLLQPYASMVKVWVKEVFPIPSDAKIKLTPTPTKLKI